MGSRRSALAHVDRPLLVVIVAICLLGLYNLSSAGHTLGSSLHWVQAVHMATGLVLMTIVASVDYRNFEGLATPLFVLTVVLLLVTALFGKTVNGSQRWLTIPGLFNLQTSDPAKLSVILMVAKVLHLEGGEGRGLTLNEVFRPLNVSRPLLLVLAVLALTLAGDVLRPPGLTRMEGKRPRTVARFSSGTDRLVIGRASDANVSFKHREVERQHAELVRTEEGQFVLRDLDSGSGTYVNGVRITTEQRVSNGDVIRVGLSARGELIMKAPMERIRRFLPWIAIVAAIWLLAAMILQLKKGSLKSRDLVAPIDVVVLPCGLVLIQPDLGTAVVTMAIAFTIILYVGLRPVSLLLLGLLSVVGGAIAWLLVLMPYQKERVLTFLNPTSDLLGAGYHQHQSLIAIGSGAFTGKGHGQGTQTQLRFLPEMQTDFVFSVWAEEHGFIGCFVVVVLFAALVLLSLRLAVQAKDKFGALLVVGVTAMIFFHAVINMLMVIRLAPVVGVPLPLWSYGGSFVMTTMIGLGIILNVGMRRFVF